MGSVVDRARLAEYRRTRAGRDAAADPPADLLTSYTRDGNDSRAGIIVEALLAASPEVAELWKQHPVAGTYCGAVRLQHPQVGELELHCQRLVDPATPGTDSHEKIQLLSVLGGQTMFERS
jgi:hypothetical protein